MTQGVTYMSCLEKFIHLNVNVFFRKFLVDPFILIQIYLMWLFCLGFLNRCNIKFDTVLYIIEILNPVFLGKL